MTVHIGFTGTRDGMTQRQVETVTKLLCDLGATDLHHGDCVGADRDAHMVGLVLDLTMHLHGPLETRFRALCEVRLGVDIVYAPKPYLERDRDIVDTTKALIAAPKELTEVLRSGTWATVRYAIKQRKPVFLVFPNGEVCK